MRIFHIHDWTYGYERYSSRVHAFSTGLSPDWIDRKCSKCNKLEPNRDYQMWLNYLEINRLEMELERKKYGHPRGIILVDREQKND